MVKVKSFKSDGASGNEFELDKELFNVEVKNHLIYEYVKQYLANQRQGTAKAKGRSDVSGGGAKPFKQKGTGRARQGTNTSPLSIRGGKTFGPENRNYYSNFPVKMKNGAFKAVLSSKAQDEDVSVIESFAVADGKTKGAKLILDKMGLYGQKNLIIVDEYDQKTELATRNVKGLRIKKVRDLNAYDVLNGGNIIFTKLALDKLESRK